MMTTDDATRTRNDHEQAKRFEMLDAKDIQEIFDICERKAYELMDQPDFPTIKIGRCVRIPARKLEEWIERNVNNERSMTT